MNRTPRSRTIELISLNTSRGVWNWRIVWESPKVNVASRRPCASSTETSSVAFTWMPKLERRWFALFRRCARSNFASTVNPSQEVTNAVTVACGSSFIVVSNSSRDPYLSARRFLNTSRVPSIARPASTSPLWISSATSTGLRFGASAFSGAFGPPFEGTASGAFSTTLLSLFFGGAGAGFGFDCSVFQNLKGIPARRSGGRVIRFAARESASGRKCPRTARVPNSAVTVGAQGIPRVTLIPGTERGGCVGQDLNLRTPAGQRPQRCAFDHAGPPTRAATIAAPDINLRGREAASVRGIGGGIAGGLYHKVREHSEPRNRIVAGEREIRAGDPRAGPRLQAEVP